MPKEGCVDFRKDDPIAFSIIWQINNLLEKLTNHVSASEVDEDFERCREHLYVMSIGIEERLISPKTYEPSDSFLAYYHYRSSRHFRRFH